MENGLESKLQRVENTNTSIKGNLDLSPNAPIEEVVTATELKLKNLLNIYVQEEEPENKDGIWLQMPNFEYNSITIDETLGIKDEPCGEDKWPKFSQSAGPLCIGEIDGVIYGACGTNVYTFDKETMQATFYATAPFGITDGTGGAVIHNGKFYSCTSLSKIRCYNPITKEKELDVNVPASPYYAGYIGAYENYIFLFTQTNGVGYKYNLDTGEWTQTAKPPRHLQSTNTNDNRTLAWNGMFLFPNTCTGSSYSDYTLYGYNIEKDTWVKMKAQQGSYQCYSYVIVGDYMYTAQRSYGTDYWRKVNLVTGEKTLINITREPNNSMLNMNVVNGSIFIFFNSSLSGLVLNLATDTSTYDENTIVVVQGQYKLNPYDINLFSLPETKGGKLMWSFADVYPYKDGELLTDIPSYYGDGTQWIRFKN